MPAVRSPEPRTNLPAELTNFIGRRREIAEIRTLLSQSRLVTLTGMGGVGKTRLARRVGATAARGFTHGVWEVELADLHEHALLVPTIASAIGLREQSEPWTVRTLVERLRGRRLLVLLDNCEHLIEACADVVQELLEGCPKLRILATSREPFGVLGERTFGVHPLPVPNVHQVTVDSLLKYDSVTLFFDRAAEVCPDFEVNADNIASVAGLCVRLEGVPLAIELAAVWLRTLSPVDLLQQLTEHYALLRRGHRGASSRQQSLRSLIDWSYQLCAPDEKSLWQRIAVFAQGFELDAVAWLYRDELTGLDLIELIDRLVAKSVLFVNPHTEHVRYRMPLIIREYGLEQLAQTGDHLPTRHRHREWCVQMAMRARREWVGPDQLVWFNRIHSELPNIRAALEFSLTLADSADDVVRVVAALIDYWIAQALLGEGTHWLDRACTQRLEDASRLTALRVQAILATVQGDRALADRTLENAAKLAAGGASETEAAWLSMASALASMYAGKHSTAQPELDIAEGLFRQVGDLNGLIWALTASTVTQSTSPDPNLTHARYERYLRVAELHGERWSKSYCLWAVAFAHYRDGNVADALDSLRAGLRQRAPFDDEFALGQSLELLGWIVAAQGRTAEAATLLGRADSAFLTAGSSVTALTYLIDGHQRCVRELQTKLGPATFDALFDRGRRLRISDYFAVADQDSHDARATIVTETQILTAREREVAQLVAQGLMNKEIADRLLISLRTAETHVEHILVKLGYTSRTQIAALMASRAT